jgi:hypothetical protein
MWPAGILDRLTADPLLTYVTVSRGRLAAGLPAVVVYQGGARWGISATVVPGPVRLEGYQGRPVYTAVVLPPVTGHPEPYNTWIETRSALVEF